MRRNLRIRLGRRLRIRGDLFGGEEEGVDLEEGVGEEGVDGGEVVGGVSKWLMLKIEKRGGGVYLLLCSSRSEDEICEMNSCGSLALWIRKQVGKSNDATYSWTRDKSQETLSICEGLRCPIYPEYLQLFPSCFLPTTSYCLSYPTISPISGFFFNFLGLVLRTKEDICDSSI